MELKHLVKPVGTEEPLHCDSVIHRSRYPICLRYFLLVHRLPAIDRAVIVQMHGEPVCYADHQGTRVRLTMASRFGDVGITKNLNAVHGYERRVGVDQLENFS